MTLPYARPMARQVLITGEPTIQVKDFARGEWVTVDEVPSGVPVTIGGVPFEEYCFLCGKYRDGTHGGCTREGVHP